MRVASIEIAAKAVLFDMDGVVVDSRSVIEMAWREVVRKFDGRELTELEIRTVAHGRTPEQTIETLFPEYGDEQRQEIWSEAARIEMSAPYEAIPGVEDFTERLSSSGIAIGLVTSSWPEKTGRCPSGCGRPDPDTDGVTAPVWSAPVARSDLVCEGGGEQGCPPRRGAGRSSAGRSGAPARHGSGSGSGPRPRGR